MGKKFSEFEAMRIFTEQLTADTWKQIVATAIEAAKAGDAEARAWVALYAMGWPQEVPCRLSGIGIAESMQTSNDGLLTDLFSPAKVKKSRRGVK
ncbi:MAG: hypothetical protein P4L44_16575 [Oryzomonas sp.]|uniref:hypothetical protein n=1 Tax=Oryzomonas sp. TaxID=2855186 RepID=UPI0028464A02|nr:hypothetical protein [Oryzomonas sp.]MDR3581578.1 hypothetical protein [Oryzomonas sp.]